MQSDPRPKGRMPMTDPIEQASASGPGPQSLAELFHLVGSLVPKDQTVRDVPPDTTVGEAIRIMSKHNFSQLPIVAGDTVLGVFSFRSLASGLLKMGQVPEQFSELPVDEFTEQFRYVQLSDNWESILDHLNSDDGVLVGQRERLHAIVTAMDVLNYLHDEASPFVLLAEIELSLRKIINECVNGEQLEGCIRTSLADKYGSDAMPARLSEMTFNDYVQIIGHGHNWPYFSVAFGEGEWQRKATTRRLSEVRDRRNDAFHFRRPLTEKDREILTAHRNWLQMKARTFEAKKAVKVAPAKLAPAREEEKAKSAKKRAAGRKWDEPSFFAALKEGHTARESAAARRIFDWVTDSTLSIRWGRGREGGSFSATFGDAHGPAVLRVWTSGWVTIAFLYLKSLPPYDDEKMRLELLRRLNEIRRVEIDPSEIVKDTSVRLSIFADEAKLQQLLDAMDWVVEEIERAAAGPDEPAHDDYLRVLTHIPVPRGQQQLYKALYDAGDEGLTHDELVEAMGRRDLQDLSGVLGALGRRISGVPGYGQARRPGVEMVIARETAADGPQRLRLVPEMRAALEELDPGWLHEMTP
jgi:CBS domain-containing protein